MLVGLQVNGQLAYAMGQDRDLHLRRPGISLLALIVLNQLRFCFGGDSHRRRRILSLARVVLEAAILASSVQVVQSGPKQG